MLTVESHLGRTIVGRLERGDDLIEGLRAVCAARQIRTGVVSAIGALEQAEVTHYLPSTRAYGKSRTLRGPLEILSLAGNLSESEGELSIHVHATLSREGDNGVEVFGGHLLSGRVFAIELSIVALDDILLRRAPDPGTGLRLWYQGFEQGPDGAGRIVEPVTSGTTRSLEAPGDLLSEDHTAPEPGVPQETHEGPTPRARSRARTPETPARATDPASIGEGGTSRLAEGDSGAEAIVGTAAGHHRAPRPSPIAWDEVVAASSAAQRDPPELPIRPDREARAFEDEIPAVEEEEEEEPADYVDLEAGDLIEHPKFGRCRVERVEGEEEYVHVRLRNRNLVRLSLDVITLELIGSEGGHQVFRARIG